MKILKEIIVVYESFGFNCRLWIQIPENSVDEVELIESVYRSLNKIDFGLFKSFSQCAEYLLGMDQVNAVEVKDPTKNFGVVFYKDWP